jgi:hypothetical protein
MTENTTSQTVVNASAIAEYVGITDDRERTLSQCRIAFDALGHLEGKARADMGTAFAEAVTDALAIVMFPDDVASQEWARNTSVQSKGAKVTHTSLFQRSDAWALASKAGVPTRETIQTAMRLATLTRKGIAGIRKEILEGGDMTPEAFAKRVNAVIDAAKADKSATTGNAAGGATAPATVHTFASMLDALVWAQANTAQAFDGLDADALDAFAKVARSLASDAIARAKALASK